MKPNGPRDLEPYENLYKHPRIKQKCVYGFQGDLNPTSLKGFIV